MNMPQDLSCIIILLKDLEQKSIYEDHNADIMS